MARDTTVVAPNARVGRWLAVALAALVALGTAACSSGGASASSETAAAKVKAAWTTFFSGKTPAAEKLAHLEDAAGFSSVVHAEVSSSIAKETSAKVGAVKVTGDEAAVHYTIDLAGAPALKNQVGRAVREHGTWKVSSGSFCGLLSLEQVKTAACPSSST